MIPAPLQNIVDRMPVAWRAMALKAVSFALVGVVNATVNYAVFWLILTAIETTPFLARGFDAAVAACGCATNESAKVIVANTIAWIVAVCNSYVMNSFFTFAAESGRKLSWRAFFTFAASGILGLVADTTTLLIASRYFPIMGAKLISIGAGFVVNFMMSHFVVFRVRNPDSHAE
jgi:putative flippase GtrA